MTKKPTVAQQLIEYIFDQHYEPGVESFEWRRDELISAAHALGLNRPGNLGDVIYAFRSYRTPIPEAVQRRAPKGKSWYIVGAGKSKYRFVAEPNADIEANPLLEAVKVPDATPGVVAMYALDDEQALLAQIRYNRLLDVFTGVTCYSLQSHWRAFVPGRGQIECDEVYVGLDRFGAHYVFPVEAKGRKEKLNVIQIRNNFEICAVKFPDLICVPIGAKLIEPGHLALFSFRHSRTSVKLSEERQYELVPAHQLDDEDLASYAQEAKRSRGR